MVPTARPWRLSGIAGLLFVGLSFVASGMNVAGLAFLLFYFPFFSGLCERLRHAEGAPAVWARVTWAGAIISPAVGTIAGTFIVGAALLGSRVSPDIARFAIASNFYAYVVSGALSGIVVLGAAVVILRTSIFSRWVGWARLLLVDSCGLHCADSRCRYFARDGSATNSSKLTYPRELASS
jgi:hypothetical protein